MVTETQLGMNRTGISTSRSLSDEMIAGTAEFPPDAPGDERKIAAARSVRAKDADPIGSLAPPSTLRGMIKTLGTAVRGESPTLFVDKLGERLAFERTGVRLYEGMLSKFDAFGSFEGGPTRLEIENILGDEFNHFRLLEEALSEIGADPTAMTPSADLHATLSKGALEVMVDPRTNFVQSLEALLFAELADNDCWRALVTLSEQAGQGGLAARFQRALAEEDVHLAKVRHWLAIAQGRVRA